MTEVKKESKKKKYVNPVVAWTLILVNLGVAVAIFFIELYPLIQEYLAW